MKILCLHGRGSNNQIFRMQTAAIRAELEDFEWVFVQGTVRHTEGNWSLHTSDFSKLPLYSYYSPYDPESILQTRDELLYILRHQGPFDGVFAYSGGAALAAELIIEAAQSPAFTEPLFRFAIFVNGASPLRVVYMDEVESKEDVLCVPRCFQKEQEMFFRASALRQKNGVSEEDQVDPGKLLALLSRLEGRVMADGTPLVSDGYHGLCRWDRERLQPGLIEMATLHVRSTDEDEADPHHGKHLLELCEESEAEDLHHACGHDFPRGRKLIKQIARAIRDMAESA